MFKLRKIRGIFTILGPALLTIGLATHTDIACVIVLEISHHLAGVPMWLGWSRERVGSWQRRHSSAEDGQRVHPGQQLLVYGRHAYATGQRPQPQGKRVITESGNQLLKQVMRLQCLETRWTFVAVPWIYMYIEEKIVKRIKYTNFTIFTREQFNDNIEKSTNENIRNNWLLKYG